MKRLLLIFVPLALLVSACWFRYGETKAYGDETPHGTVAISDDQAHPVAEPISGTEDGQGEHDHEDTARPTSAATSPPKTSATLTAGVELEVRSIATR